MTNLIPQIDVRYMQTTPMQNYFELILSLLIIFIAQEYKKNIFYKLNSKSIAKLMSDLKQVANSNDTQCIFQQCFTQNLMVGGFESRRSMISQFIGTKTLIGCFIVKDL